VDLAIVFDEKGRQTQCPLLGLVGGVDVVDRLNGSDATVMVENA
jgi:hypothetical protein